MEKTSSSFYYDDYPKIPHLTFEKREHTENLVVILDTNEVEKFPEFLIKYFKSNPFLLSDLKANSFVTLYTLSDQDLFIRGFVYYEKELNNHGKNYQKLQNLGSTIYRKIKEFKLTKVDFHFPQNATHQCIALVLNAFALTNYKFDRKKCDDPSKKTPFVSHINVQYPEIKELDEDSKFIYKTAYYSLLAREMQNERANIATTIFVLERAKEIAAANPKITFDAIVGEELVKKGLNLVYAVGKGSSTPPALVTLSYNGNPDSKGDVYAIVGKGIVFDAGGLNIKATGAMEDMYMDKSGACCVLAVLKAVAELNLPINVVGTLALAENFLSSTAYRPSDIIKSLKGLTIEIGNTDAEGRLVLADAMTWTQQNFKPKVMIELSTLTGACLIALGGQTAGLFTTNDVLARNIIKTGDFVSEKYWRLPIFDEHRETMKSKSADLSNTGESKYGGASKAAAFLENFVEPGVAWTHLDIAGPTLAFGDKGVYTGGATGFGVKTVLTYLKEKSTGNNKIVENEF